MRYAHWSRRLTPTKALEVVSAPRLDAHPAGSRRRTRYQGEAEEGPQGGRQDVLVSSGWLQLPALPDGRGGSRPVLISSISRTAANCWLCATITGKLHVAASLRSPIAARVIRPKGCPGKEFLSLPAMLATRGANSTANGSVRSIACRVDCAEADCHDSQVAREHAVRISRRTDRVAVSRWQQSRRRCG